MAFDEKERTEEKTKKCLTKNLREIEDIFEYRLITEADYIKKQQLSSSPVLSMEVRTTIQQSLKSNLLIIAFDAQDKKKICCKLSNGYGFSLGCEIVLSEDEYNNWQSNQKVLPALLLNHLKLNRKHREFFPVMRRNIFSRTPEACSLSELLADCKQSLNILEKGLACLEKKQDNVSMFKTLMGLCATSERLNKNFKQVERFCTTTRHYAREKHQDLFAAVRSKVDFYAGKTHNAKSNFFDELECVDKNKLFNTELIDELSEDLKAQKIFILQDALGNIKDQMRTEQQSAPSFVHIYNCPTYKLLEQQRNTIEEKKEKEEINLSVVLQSGCKLLENEIRKYNKSVKDKKEESVVRNALVELDKKVFFADKYLQKAVENLEVYQKIKDHILEKLMFFEKKHPGFYDKFQRAKQSQKKKKFEPKKNSPQDSLMQNILTKKQEAFLYFLTTMSVGVTVAGTVLLQLSKNHKP